MHNAEFTTSFPLHEITPLNPTNSLQVTDGIFNYVDIDNNTDYDYKNELTPEQERKRAADEESKAETRKLLLAFGVILGILAFVAITFAGGLLLQAAARMYIERCEEINESAEEKGWSMFSRILRYIFSWEFALLILASTVFL